LGSLEQLNVAYFFGKINNSTDLMIREFCNVRKDDNFVKEIDMAKPGNIFAMALYTVSTTIDKSIAATVVAG
jgi:hypothetical protein